MREGEGVISHRIPDIPRLSFFISVSLVGERLEFPFVLHDLGAVEG